MNPLIETYKIFVESVKAEFGPRNAAPIIKEGYEALCEAIGDTFSIDHDDIDDLARKVIKSYIDYIASHWRNTCEKMCTMHMFVGDVCAEFKGKPIAFTLCIDPITTYSEYAGRVSRDGSEMILLTFGNPQGLTDIMDSIMDYAGGDRFAGEESEICDARYWPDKTETLIHLRTFLEGDGWPLLNHELTHMAQHAMAGLDNYGAGGIEYNERPEEQEAFMADIRNDVKFGVKCDVPLDKILEMADQRLNSAKRLSHGHDVEGLADYAHDFVKKLYVEMRSKYTDEMFDKGMARMNTMETIDKIANLLYRDDTNGLHKTIVETIVDDLNKVMTLNKENKALAKEYAIRKADEYMKTHYGN